MNLTNYAKCLALLALPAMLIGCDQPYSQQTIQEQGVLRVISRNGPTTYFEDRHGPTGFEYELAKKFADYLGVELEIQSVHSLEEIFAALANAEVHLAAAGLTITEERQKRMNFSPSYMEIKQYVLYRDDRFRPHTPADMEYSNITILAASSHEEILNQLQSEYRGLEFLAATDVETIDLLEMLDKGEIDYTIVDSNEYEANRNFYPNLNIGFEIGQPGQLGWALPGAISTPDLEQSLIDFFAQLREDDTIKQLEERFYSKSEQGNRIGTLTFNQAVDKRLPKYLPLIQQVAQEYDLSWHLLAAISYQESHWNPKARSPTGVRGMMMLTRPTAKEMGVKNRLDTVESLRGGARYFKKIHGRIPERIAEPDRSWFALAAYNVGLGHLEDARKITQQQGGNPDKWLDVKERLPLLSKRRWYKNTKHGYARGHEPVTYVQNIRHYYNLLSWSDIAKNRTPPPKQVEQYLPDSLQREIRAL